MVVKASMLWKEWLFAEPYAAQGKFEKENLSAKAAQLTDFFLFFIFFLTEHLQISSVASARALLRACVAGSCFPWAGGGRCAAGGAGAALLEVPSSDGWELRQAAARPKTLLVGWALLGSSNPACSP